MAGLPKVGIEAVVEGADKAVQDAGRVKGAIDGIGSAAETAAQKSGALDAIGDKMRGIGDKISGIGLKMTGALTLPIVGLGTVAVMAASNLDESMNKVDVVFGDSAGVIKQFADDAAINIGMSEQAALDAAGTFGNLFTSMGMGEGVAADMSADLIQLAGDMASFNNITPEEALEKLRSGLVGEVEPLRAVGVLLSATAVEEKALAMGLANTKDEITPAIQAQARYALILEQTTNQQGDYARTSDGLANQMRTIKAQVANTSASFGKLLIPYVQKAAEFVSKLLEKFENMSPTTRKVILIILGVVAVMGPLLMIIGSIISAIGVIMPVIGAVVGILSGPVLLVVGAVIAVVALLAAAWKNNWGGIREKTAAVWDWLKGVFGGIVDWFKKYIPEAIAVLKGWWENTLLPAFQKVWDFISVYIIPIFQAIADIINLAVKLAIEVLAGLWENVLLPALTKVWQFIQDKVLPIFKSLRDFIVNEIGPKILWFKEVVIDPLAKAIKEGIGGALKWVLEKLQAFRDKLAEIKLPDFLKVESPTPFEVGLLGIHDALVTVNQDVANLGRGLMNLPNATVGVSYQNQGLSSPAVSSMLRPVSAPAMAGMGGGNNYNVPITVNANVNNSQDVHELAYVIAREFNRRTSR